jgi:lipopolysaccharide exporter
VVALRGFTDLRYKLQQRDHRFEAEARIEISRSIAEVAALLAIGLIFHSYWAVVVAAYTNAIVQVLLSHLGAPEPYRLAPRKRLLALVGKFSAPIYFNAALLLVAIQGDRLVVATLFEKSELAFYTVACAISQGLTVVINRVTMNLLLPRMTSKDLTFEARREQVNRLGLGMIALSTGFLIVMTVVGPSVTRLVYGGRYHGLVAIIYASSIVNMIQIEQVWASTLLMANGRTAPLPVITLMRATALPIAIIFAKTGSSLLAIPLAFAVGSAFSLATSYFTSFPLRLVGKRLIAFSFARTTLLIAAGPALATVFPVGGAG